MKLQEKFKDRLKNNQLSSEDKKIIEELLDDTKLGLRLHFEEKHEEFNLDNKMYKMDDFYSVFEEDKEKRIIKNDLLKSNLLIEAENYLALKHLQKIGQKVDIIYIDPPYNTGNEFIYNDNRVDKNDSYKHSKWLSFMKKRLEIAYDLLSDKGVIFVSIDDNEQAYLKVLMDEIFGEERFICNFIWRKKSPANKVSNSIAIVHEYVLTYTKNPHQTFNKIFDKDLKKYKNHDNDPRGEWILDNPTAASGSEKNGMFEIIDPISKTKSILPTGRYWAFSEKTLQKWLEEGKAFFKNGKIQIKKYKNELESLKLNNSSILEFETDSKIVYTTNATKEFKKLGFNSKDFKYPKPVDLIKHLIKLVPNDNQIILDFFAGSGTTGHAVMDLNKEDGGDRRFILITNNENDIVSNITYERLHRIIKGEGTKGEKDFKWLDKNKPYINENINSNLKYLKLKPIHKIDGNFEEIKTNQELYKKEFEIDDISIDDINEK